MEKCLLIKTKDGRKFLTHEKNLPSLIEFAKTFGAEIDVVKPNDGSKILELKTLTTAVCDSLYNEEPQYQIVEKLYPSSQKRDRQTILAEATRIRKFIQDRLLEGKPVSLKELKEMYKEHKLTDACLCNHLAVVRKALGSQGRKFRKLGAGKYCLVG